MNNASRPPRYIDRGVSRKHAAIVNVMLIYVVFGIVFINGIVLVPLYIEKIPDHLYGGWLAVGGLISWLQLVDPGFSKVLQQRVASTYGQKDYDKLRRVIGTGLLIGMCLSLVAITAWPLAGLGVRFLGMTGAEAVELRSCFQIAIVGTALALVSYQPMAALGGLQKNITIGFIHVLPSLACIGVTVGMLKSGYGLASIPVGLLCKNALTLLFSTVALSVWCWRYLPGRLELTWLEARSYGGLLSLSFVERMGDALIQQSDTWLIAWILTPATAVVYQLTGRAFEMVKIVVGRLAPALAPSLSHLAGTGDFERLREIVGRITNYIGFLAAVGAASVLCLNHAFVNLWVGNRFYGGLTLTALIAVSTVLSILLNNLSEVLYAMGGIREVSFAKLLEGVIKLPLQWVLTTRLGLIGIPLGSCLAMLAVGIWLLPIAVTRRLHQNQSSLWIQFGLMYARPLAMFVVGWLLVGFVNYLNPGSTWGRFLAASLGTGCLLLSVALLLYGRVRGELQQLVLRVVRRLNPLALKS